MSLGRDVFLVFSSMKTEIILLKETTMLGINSSGGIIFLWIPTNFPFRQDGIQDYIQLCNIRPLFNNLIKIKCWDVLTESVLKVKKLKLFRVFNFYLKRIPPPTYKEVMNKTRNTDPSKRNIYYNIEMRKCKKYNWLFKINV